VCPRDEDDAPVRAVRWDSERVALALDDERGDGDCVELGQAGLLRPPRRVDRECQAENGYGSGLGHGPARNARACGAAADDQREALEELADDRNPGLVELARRRLAFSARDAVWLLDERHAQPRFGCRLTCSGEVGRLDPAAGPVPEHERSSR
jgi:hypothetical protein